jgi:hypothetical protein
MEALNETAMALATKVYQEAAKKAEEQTSTEDNNSDEAPKDDVINADFEEKK